MRENLVVDFAAQKTDTRSIKVLFKTRILNQKNGTMDICLHTHKYPFSLYIKGEQGVT